MKCEFCGKEQNEMARCKVCDTKYCEDCGDYELMMCNDCIEAESGLDGEMGDLNE